ncbi:AMP-binding protein [Exiguobacterium indicum]|uniref:AMP-binding protein n=1 Tax=Exiguobacterium indicum TaxID=296995 RepID=UPI002B257DAA|nr:AMP-binding protein [Exiguobacterium indicum]
MLWIEKEWVTEEELTIHELVKQSFITEGKTVAICTSDTKAWLALCLAMRRMNGTILPIHPDTPVSGAKRLAIQAGCGYLIYQETIIPLPEAEKRAGGLIQFSSGTTGQPKIIHRTWESIETELNAYTNSFPLTTKATIVACPTTHSFGLLCGVFATLRRGATPVILQDFSPRHVLAIHRLHPDAIIYTAPGLAYAMSLFPESVHAVMISGMTLPEKWFRSIERKTHHLLQQYGCSEIGCIALHPNPPSPQAIGFPLEHLEIETGTKGKPAELVVSQQNERIGTKDLMYFEDGLHFLSRLDEMINVSGLSVYPGEVEDVLHQLPTVEAVVVFKRMDPFQGERVCAQLVTMASEKELKQHCMQHLAPHQRPTEWQLVEQIEVSANGKVSRKRLGEQACPV